MFLLLYQQPVDPTAITAIAEQGPWAVMALIAWGAVTYFLRQHAAEKQQLLKTHSEEKAAYEKRISDLKLEHNGQTSELKRQLDKLELEKRTAVKDARLDERQAAMDAANKHIERTNNIQAKHAGYVEKQVDLMTQMQQAIASTQAAIVEIKDTMTDQRFEALERLLRNDTNERK